MDGAHEVNLIYGRQFELLHVACGGNQARVPRHVEGLLIVRVVVAVENERFGVVSELATRRFDLASLWSTKYTDPYN